MSQEQFHNGSGAWSCYSDQQRSLAFVGNRVGISAVIEQQLRLRRIVDGVHQRGGVRVIVRVRIRSMLQQNANRLGISVKRGVHQRSGTVSSLSIPHTLVFSQNSKK